MRLSVINELARMCKSLWVPSGGLPAVTGEKHKNYLSVQSESGQEFENRNS
jgi:hypothetical protein